MPGSESIQDSEMSASLYDEKDNSPLSASMSPRKAVKSAKKSLELLTVVTEFKSDKPNMLRLLVGDTVHVLNKTESGWWDGAIVTDKGTIRGWFPSSYCKTVNPHNPSGNMRPQNLSALLRQNLVNNSRSRKNSSVSFASSDHSYQSDSIYHSQQEKSQQTQSHTPTVDATTVVNSSKVKISSAREVETIFNSIGSSNIPVWVPLATTDGSLLYHNAELDLFCKDLPFLESPELDANAVITIPRSITQQMPSNLSASNLSGSMSVKSKHSIAGLSLNERKRSETSSKSMSFLPSYTATSDNFWKTPLYCEDDLFYYDPTDAKSWSQLRDAFLYFISLSSDALHKKDDSRFKTCIKIASSFSVLIQLAATLSQHELQKSGYRNRVKKKLRKISSSFAHVCLNGDLYLADSYGNPPTGGTDPFESNEAIKEYFLEEFDYGVSSLRKNTISLAKIFNQVSSSNLNTKHNLPEIYPRFLAGHLSGGNWNNPFVSEPRILSSAKGLTKSLHYKRVPKLALTKETLEDLEASRDQIKMALEDVSLVLKEKENTKERNVELLTKGLGQLQLCSQYIDLIEGLDFSIFLHKTVSDSIDELDLSKLIYPVLTEFFESKQSIRDTTVSLLIGLQNLTLGDPSVFASIKEDGYEMSNKFANDEPEKYAKEIEAELVKLDVERDYGIMNDATKSITESISKIFELLDISTILVQQLVNEKEAFMNYATRIMDHNGLQFAFLKDSREDSALVSDEIQLPSSATSKNNQSDVPWYLRSQEYHLIFTNNTNDATIKGGTKEALIERLTHHDVFDIQFNMAFLLTFRSMMDAPTFIELLVKRFNLEQPENLSFEQYSDWAQKMSYPVKLRVVNIMKLLLQKYWVQDYNELKLVGVWGPFINSLFESKFQGCEQLFKEFQRRVIKTESNDQQQQQPLGVKPTSFSLKAKKMKLMEIDPEELANQLTLRDSAIYSLIKPTEYLEKAWGKKYGSLGGWENLQKFINNSNDLTYYIVSQIVKHTDVKKRINIIKYFVNVAEKCRQLNNFSGMTAIISALYSAPIYRLKNTWSAVPSATMALKEELNDLMNPKRNFNNYREHIKEIFDKPCVLFLGVFLTDLDFITTGNSDHLHNDPQLINFAKRSKTAEIIKEVTKYQSLQYKMKKNDDVLDFINLNIKSVMTPDEQYNKSLVIEPRIKMTRPQHQKVKKTKSRSSTSSARVKPKHFAAFGPI